LSSCFTEREVLYPGHHPELFSIAINSILGARGFQVGGLPGGTGINATTRVIDEDNYERILFSYGEGDISYVIMQKVDEDYVYFYPHYNFISFQGVWLSWEERQHSRRITDEDLEELKKANSWNKEMSDSSKFVRVRIVRRKEDGPISDDKLVRASHLIFPERNSTRTQIITNTIFLRTDRYGRAIYSFGGYAALFQPDHSFDIETGILEITDRFNYQTELRLFMEANGWDTPFEE